MVWPKYPCVFPYFYSVYGQHMLPHPDVPHKQSLQTIYALEVAAQSLMEYLESSGIIDAHILRAEGLANQQILVLQTSL